jgi:hypothetical protein
MSANPPPTSESAKSIAGKVILILALAGASVFIYWRFIHPKQKEMHEPAVSRLLRMSNEQMDSLFEPLDWNTLPVQPHLFRDLREELADLQAAAQPFERESYKLAVQLADTMPAASTERKQTNDAVRDAENKLHVTSLGTPEEVKAKHRFFAGPITRRWEQSAPAYKAKTVELYTRLRAEERRIHPGRSTPVSFK